MDGLRPHERYGKEGEYGVTCQGSEEECVPMPLKAGELIKDLDDDGIPLDDPIGSCGLHGGQTLHYSRGNSTDTWRRAYILNYRPKSMVRLFAAVATVILATLRHILMLNTCCRSITSVQRALITAVQGLVRIKTTLSTLRLV